MAGEDYLKFNILEASWYHLGKDVVLLNRSILGEPLHFSLYKTMVCDTHIQKAIVKSTGSDRVFLQTAGFMNKVNKK